MFRSTTQADDLRDGRGGTVHGSQRVPRGAVVSADDDRLSRVGQARSDDVRQADVDYGVGTTGEIQQEAGGIVRVVLVLVGLLATGSRSVVAIGKGALPSTAAAARPGGCLGLVVIVQVPDGAGGEGTPVASSIPLPRRLRI